MSKCTYRILRGTNGYVIKTMMKNTPNAKELNITNVALPLVTPQNKLIFFHFDASFLDFPNMLFKNGVPFEKLHINRILMQAKS